MIDANARTSRKVIFGTLLMLPMIVGFGLLSLFVVAVCHVWLHDGGYSGEISSGRVFDNFGAHYFVLARRAFMVLLSLFTAIVSFTSLKRKRFPWVILAAVANPIVFFGGVAFARLLARTAGLPSQGGASLDPAIYGCLIGASVIGIAVGLLTQKRTDVHVAHV